jgi:hypothetical protein
MRLEKPESVNLLCGSELDRGRYRIRTCDFHRVNFEVVNLKPFACLAFPVSRLCEDLIKQPGFGDELVTSFGDRWFCPEE